MMWEAYVALQKAAAAGQTFDDVRRRMADYVVAGLQMTPRDATYTEQRDAILAAALAARPDSDAADPDDLGAGGSDVIVLANAFARRGAGTCAIAPPRNSLNLVGVTESYDLRPRIGLGSIRVELAPPSCDADGFLDAAERGRIVMPLLNGGPVEMVGTNVSFSSSIAGLTFPAGSSATVSRLAPFSSTEITIPVELSAGFSGIGRLEIGATASADAACVTSVTRIAREFVNVNEVLNSSRIDTVESPTSAWTSTGARAADVWSRVEAAPFDLAWLGIDLSTMSDTQLVSPALQVSATAPLVITLSHRHSFERDGTVLFDGGVIEVSRDGGATWQDITTYGANPGYGGTLFVGSGNPLGGRQARVGTNASWPAPDTLTLNLGMALAGQTIRIRFRIGTDAAVGDFGWQLDNLSFEGITNTPFATLVADATPCRRR